MILFDTGAAKFAFRAAGVMLHDGYVLLQHDAGTWFLPGGRVELLELAHDALNREMREELGVDVEVGRMLWVFEGFSRQGKKIRHELSLAFLVRIPPGPVRDDKATPILCPEQEWVLHFEWLPLAQIEQLPLYPPCLGQRLLHLPAGIEHLMHARNDLV
jgi:ADP-ribose pyrophosphatase YjhB (NUDIX family)